ncbi:MAG TPA: GDSL-type esterase/lipase family protein, partial [Acetobacteraceae bacterium]|nr:GDSL-type esterase/lipase family protein [Acetobacteraceae bacterium]
MRSFLRVLLAVTALLAVSPAPSGAAAHHTVLAAVPISRMDLPWWRHRHEQKLAELHRGRVDLIWLGDSITQDWERHGPPAWADFAPVWQQFYGDRHAVNLGFIGDTTASLLWRIENGEVSGIAPKVAIVLIGANNMGRPHWSADDTVAGIGAVIAQLRTRLPHTRVLLLGVLPSERSAWITVTTAEINRMLAAKYGQGRVDQVTFLDVTPVFMRNGRLDRDLFLDPKEDPPRAPLHPDADGQAKMAA